MIGKKIQIQSSASTSISKLVSKITTQFNNLKKIARYKNKIYKAPQDIAIFKRLGVVPIIFGYI